MDTNEDQRTISIKGFMPELKEGHLVTMGLFPLHDESGNCIASIPQQFVDMCREALREKEFWFPRNLEINYSTLLSAQEDPEILAQEIVQSGKLTFLKRRVQHRQLHCPPSFFVDLFVPVLIHRVQHRKPKLTDNVWSYTVGPFKTLSAADEWAEAIEAALEPSGLDYRTEVFEGHSLSLMASEEARLLYVGGLAHCISEDLIHVHPPACTVCFPTETSKDPEDNLWGVVILQGSFYSGEFQVVGPFKDLTLAERFSEEFNQKAHNYSPRFEHAHTFVQPIIADCSIRDEDPKITGFSSSEEVLGLVDQDQSYIVVCGDQPDVDGITLYGPTDLASIEKYSKCYPFDGMGFWTIRRMISGDAFFKKSHRLTLVK